MTEIDVRDVLSLMELSPERREELACRYEAGTLTEEDKAEFEARGMESLRQAVLTAAERAGRLSAPQLDSSREEHQRRFSVELADRFVAALPHCKGEGTGWVAEKFIRRDPVPLKALVALHTECQRLEKIHDYLHAERLKTAAEQTQPEVIQVVLRIARRSAESSKEFAALRAELEKILDPI